ncbi:MAG: hypothetical protein IPP18_18060 [Rhodocyclaceae bacterium]|nr:hypothetical protein [Rhodocyclaceae bacterium]
MELRKTLLGRFGAFEPPTMESLLCSVSIVGIPLFIALFSVLMLLVGTHHQQDAGGARLSFSVQVEPDDSLNAFRPLAADQAVPLLDLHDTRRAETPLWLQFQPSRERAVARAMLT